MRDLSTLKALHYQLWNYIVVEIECSDHVLCIPKLKEAFFEGTHLEKPMCECYMCECAENGLELERMVNHFPSYFRCKYCPSFLKPSSEISNGKIYCLSGVYYACQRKNGHTS